ncbi:unnamed protein product [Parnassius mnemosyne]|uniref:Uncharacterized protein n=1 Tax=Parnassius mnemosyne TaxID=213953 RepID=A0AAV1KWF2_9NEOP
MRASHGRNNNRGNQEKANVRHDTGALYRPHRSDENLPGNQNSAKRRLDTEKVNKAAIVLFDDTIDMTQCPSLTTGNIAVARLRTGAWEMGVVSVYLEGEKPIEPHLRMIEAAVVGLRTKNVILGGDVNA